MRSPHELLVSRSLVIAQLGAGVVEVAWALVEDQFPALAVDAAQIRRRYPDLRLSLPLDVLGGQLREYVISTPASGAAPAVSMTEAERIAARLAPFGPLDVAARRADNETLLSLVAPGLPREAIERAAQRCLPLLSTAQQVTVRMERAAMVLVPAGDAVAMVALRAGAPLALLEILVARACGAGTSTRQPDSPWGRLAAGQVHGHVSAAAGLLRGFGRVEASAFSDAACGLSVYVFSADAATAEASGAAARAVWQSLVRDDDAELGRLTSVVLRQAPRRIVVRPLTTARPAILAADGVLSLPGLAYRQVERAAHELSAV